MRKPKLLGADLKNKAKIQPETALMTMQGMMY